MRITTPSEVEKILADARDTIFEKADDPILREEIFGAIVVFSSGKTPEELYAFMAQENFEVARVESKAPIGVEGDIHTISIGSQDLALFAGNLEHKIRVGVGSRRLNLLVMGQSSGEKSHIDAAMNPIIKIYKADIIGTLGGILNALENTEVAIIILDESGTIVTNYEESLLYAERAKANMPAPTVRFLGDGPPPGVRPEQILHLWNRPENIVLPETSGHKNN